MASRLLPTTIQHIGHELALVWSDGQESYFDLEILRRSCPCAVCGGEPDVLGYVARPQVTYSPESFSLRSWQMVGGYAVQPTWEDGHSSGLYSFTYLRALAARIAEGEAEPAATSTP